MEAPGGRRGWIVLIVGLAVVHLTVHNLLGVGTLAQLIWTDTVLLSVAGAAVGLTARTARRSRDRHLRIAWAAITIGTISWWIAAALWTFRELALGEVAPAPSWLDAPFFALAPTFAVALMFYGRKRPSRALQLHQVADLGILVATLTIVGTLVLAGPIRATGFTPYVLVAIGYPGFYLAVVLFALLLLGRGPWGPRRFVLGTLVWAHLAFASVDLLYGAKVLVGEYQTTGIVDTLWLVGLLLVSWAAVEERAVQDTGSTQLQRESSWSAVVARIALAGLVALVALSADALTQFQTAEWTIVVQAGIGAAGFIGLRMWASDRIEAAYEAALAEGEQTTRALDLERTRATRLRAVGSMATGTAHEVSNLLQSIRASIYMVRRRVARGESIDTYLDVAEQALTRLTDEVDLIRKLAPTERGRGTILVLPESDPDGVRSAALARAGYAPALMPDIESVTRAVKGGDVRAILAMPAEATDLQRRQVTVPIVDARQDADCIVTEVTRLDER